VAEAAEGIYLDPGDQSEALRLLRRLRAVAGKLLVQIRESPGILHLDNQATLTIAAGLMVCPAEDRNADTEEIEEAVDIALRPPTPDPQYDSLHAAMTGAATVVDLLCAKGVLSQSDRETFLRAAAQKFRDL